MAGNGIAASGLFLCHKLCHIADFGHFFGHAGKMRCVCSMAVWHPTAEQMPQTVAASWKSTQGNRNNSVASWLQRSEFIRNGDTRQFEKFAHVVAIELTQIKYVVFLWYGTVIERVIILGLRHFRPRGNFKKFRYT